MDRLRKLLSTRRAVAPLAARLALAIVIFPHGAQKVLGWFGGHGLSGTLRFFTENLDIPLVFALLAIAAEFLGPLGLLAGLLTRVAAFGIGVTMTVAALRVHAAHGFFMDWSGTSGAEGYEFHILAVGLAVVLVLAGGGRFSADALLSRRRSGQPDPARDATARSSVPVAAGGAR